VKKKILKRYFFIGKIRLLFLLILCNRNVVALAKNAVLKAAATHVTVLASLQKVQYDPRATLMLLVQIKRGKNRQKKHRLCPQYCSDSVEKKDE
jgi:hypothetical protein